MPRFPQLLAPRERDFFALFARAGENARRATEILDELLRDYPERLSLARDVVVCERAGDEITHEIIRHLNEVFIAPFEREDVLALASAVDDIVDLVEEVVDYLELYNVEAPMQQAQELAALLHEATTLVAAALAELRGFRDLSSYTDEIKRIEQRADRLVRQAIASLFETGVDPMVVIRWKDIFERIEAAIDSTDRAANVLSGIVIKNA